MKIQSIKYALLLVVGLTFYSIAHANTSQQAASPSTYSASETANQSA